MSSLYPYEKYVEGILSKLPGSQVEYLMENSLRELSKLIQFDAAWWGWGNITDKGTRIHNSKIEGLPNEIRCDLSQVSHANPITEQIRQTPARAATYDRLQDDADLRWVAFSKKYDIRHIMVATAQDEPWNPFMFMCLYRKGDDASGWTENEKALFCKIVKLTGSIVQYCDTSCNKDKPYDAMYIDVGPGGAILTRSPRSPETLFSFFPAWRDAQCVPAQYRTQFTTVGEHILLQDGVCIKVDHLIGDDTIERFCVEIRRVLPIDILSPKEMEVARNLVNGQSIKEIARALGKSPNTVRNQVSSIYQKVGIRSRAELGAKFR